jgi:hypothetical protein
LLTNSFQFNYSELLKFFIVKPTIFYVRYVYSYIQGQMNSILYNLLYPITFYTYQFLVYRMTFHFWIGIQIMTMWSGNTLAIQSSLLLYDSLSVYLITLLQLYSLCNIKIIWKNDHARHFKCDNCRLF